jgi:probable HAF family extracellular repeat protein
MNDKGQVVGGSSLSNLATAHAFLYANGKITDLGTLPGDQNSNATSINAQGQIVGSSGTGTNSSGFIYSNGVMTNLNDVISHTTGWTIFSAVSINNLGQILAVGSNPSMIPINGSGEGFVLLTPSDLPAPGDPVYPTIIPEPSSLAVCGVMAVAFALRLGMKLRREVDAERGGAVA